MNLQTAPVPSVCVRVPYSPSLDSRKSDSPESIGGYQPRIQEFTSLAVRECATRLHASI
jgi:hypothetical protein